MNGRIYDPLLGRFLSADLVVQAPNNLQAYNRYSYVFNNPLSFTDPSGFATISEYEERIKKERAEGAAARAEAAKGGLFGSLKYLFSKENRERGARIIESEKGISGIQDHADSLDRIAGVKVDARKLDDVSPVYKLQADGFRFFNWILGAEAGGKAVRGDFTGAGKSLARDLALTWVLGKVLGPARGETPAATASAEVVEGAATELSNSEARVLYNSRLKQIDTAGPLTRETAERVHGARNTLKQEVRNLMTDKAAAEQLAKEQPLRPLEYYIEKYSAEGFQGEGLWKRIIEGGTTPNKAVNKKFGIE